jgi:hypothetical protein
MESFSIAWNNKNSRNTKALLRGARGKPGELVVMYKCVRGARGKPGELVVMYKCVRGARGKPGELVVMYKCVRGARGKPGELVVNTLPLTLLASHGHL